MATGILWPATGLGSEEAPGACGVFGYLSSKYPRSSSG